MDCVSSVLCDGVFDCVRRLVGSNDLHDSTSGGAAIVCCQDNGEGVRLYPCWLLNTNPILCLVGNNHIALCVGLVDELKANLPTTEIDLLGTYPVYVYVCPVGGSVAALVFTTKSQEGYYCGGKNPKLFFHSVVFVAQVDLNVTKVCKNQQKQI